MLQVTNVTALPPPEVRQLHLLNTICAGEGCPQYDILTLVCLCETYFAGLQFQWQRNGVDIPNADRSELRVRSAKLEDSGTYTCRIHNIAGKALWEEATISVVTVEDAAAMRAQAEAVTAQGRKRSKAGAGVGASKDGASPALKPKSKAGPSQGRQRGPSNLGSERTQSAAPETTAKAQAAEAGTIPSAAKRRNRERERDRHRQDYPPRPPRSTTMAP